MTVSMENRIKEQQLGLFADRTSCHDWWSNQFRLLLSSAAFVLTPNLSIRSGPQPNLVAIMRRVGGSGATLLIAQEKCPASNRDRAC
jgi:hypothetical protein